MTTRRSFLQGAGLALAFFAASGARAQRVSAPPPVTVYKSPACSCCGGWVAHMRAAGFRVDVKDVEDVTPIKSRLGVPDTLWSCHTAVVDGYALEGHVPAVDVQRLLRERPKMKGLAVPGMVPGSPGMNGPAQRYATIAFGDGANRTYASH
ncbi:MAG TPA: DUF411 domain-containing protein [Usitatibacter sp.]|nr:DUF411 domain-containing protein [Usitatibacter sp.]